jgi:hypothetical protein
VCARATNWIAPILGKTVKTIFSYRKLKTSSLTSLTSLKWVQVIESVWFSFFGFDRFNLPEKVSNLPDAPAEIELTQHQVLKRFAATKCRKEAIA